MTHKETYAITFFGLTLIIFGLTGLGAFLNQENTNPYFLALLGSIAFAGICLAGFAKTQRNHLRFLEEGEEFRKTLGPGGANLEATCTWGDGPDVLLELKSGGFILYENPNYFGFTHGVVRKGSMDLSAANAERLGRQLLAAAAQAREMDQGYFDSISEKGPIGEI